MPRNIIIAASLPAPPERLFDMYLDPAEHTAFTGMPVTIGARTARRFEHSTARFRVRFCTSNRKN